MAVVLNVNARKVDGETLRWMRSLVAGDDLFISRSVEDGPRIADQVVGAGYDAVLLGGGDGTFAAGVDSLARAASRRGVEMPDVGVLRLGTGNAVADAVGAGPATLEGLAEDVRRARRGLSRRTLQMLDIDGNPSMFAGFGLDAQILDDFQNTVSLLRRAGLAQTIHSAAARYFLAVASRSVPRFIVSERAEVVAVNRGVPAVRLDVDGNPIGDPIPAGRVLWRGPATLASCATIPFYGLGMKMFPHAERMPGRFQLRLTDVGAATILTHLPAIWQGSYGNTRIHDYLVSSVELVLSRPMPFQSGGDLQGERTRATISLWKRPIAVV